MRHASFKALACSICLVVISTTALAVQHNEGAYVEGNLGTLYASVNFLGTNYTGYGSAGANLNAGYQFNQNIATEVGYTNYGLSGNSLNGMDAALKLILPFNIGANDYTVFMKLGAADVFDGGDNAVVALGGLGASYSMTQHLDLNAQVQGISAGFFGLGLMSMGLTYHFD